MDSVIQSLKINHLKARLAICRVRNDSIAKEFEGAGSLAEKAAMAKKWDDALKEFHHIQLALDLLEKEEVSERKAMDRPPRTC